MIPPHFPDIGENDFREFLPDPDGGPDKQAKFVTCAKCGKTGIADNNSPGLVCHKGTYDGTTMLLYDICVLTPEASPEPRSLALSLLISLARQVDNPDRATMIEDGISKLYDAMEKADFVNTMALGLMIAITVGTKGFGEGDRLNLEDIPR